MASRCALVAFPTNMPRAGRARISARQHRCSSRRCPWPRTAPPREPRALMCLCCEVCVPVAPRASVVVAAARGVQVLASAYKLDLALCAPLASGGKIRARSCISKAGGECIGTAHNRVTTGRRGNGRDPQCTHHASMVIGSTRVQAALRRAIGELIFFAGVNDLHRCQKIVSAWGIKLDDNRCADYDRRTPLCATRWPVLRLCRS